MPESASPSLNHRILEYKQMDVTLPDFEDVFVHRVGKFAIACINARQNATLIMGKWCDNQQESMHFIQLISHMIRSGWL